MKENRSHTKAIFRIDLNNLLWPICFADNSIHYLLHIFYRMLFDVPLSLIDHNLPHASQCNCCTTHKAFITITIAFKTWVTEIKSTIEKLFLLVKHIICVDVFTMKKKMLYVIIFICLLLFSIETKIFTLQRIKLHRECCTG